MANIKVFEYEGVTITFEFTDGAKMINATQMIKAFPKKRMADFLKTQGTKDFILALEKRYDNIRVEKSINNENSNVIRIVRGGAAHLQGTWMAEKLALKFASWLSVDFELWVYDRIHELLTTGKTQIQVTPTADIFKSIRLMLDVAEANSQNIETNSQEIELLKNHVGDLEAKILSIDENYYSISGYCALHGIDCPLNKAKVWGMAATKLSGNLNKSIGKAYDAKYGAINTYHLEVLKQVVK